MAKLDFESSCVLFLILGFCAAYSLFTLTIEIQIMKVNEKTQWD